MREVFLPHPVYIQLQLIQLCCRLHSTTITSELCQFIAAFCLEREERRKKRLSEGLPPESESSSDESLTLEDPLIQARLDPLDEKLEKSPKSPKASPPIQEVDVPEQKVPKRRGRKPLKAKKSNDAM